MFIFFLLYELQAKKEAGELFICDVSDNRN